MMWTEKTNINQDMVGGDGAILLYFPPHFLEGEWRTYSSSNLDLRNYFLIPSGFYYSGGTFYYNFAYKYVKEPIDVYHDGIQKTEPFWHLVEDSPPVCELKTDKGCKLPYLERPDLGQFLYHSEKCYFIPLTGLS